MNWETRIQNLTHSLQQVRRPLKPLRWANISNALYRNKVLQFKREADDLLSDKENCEEQPKLLIKMFSEYTNHVQDRVSLAKYFQRQIENGFKPDVSTYCNMIKTINNTEKNTRSRIYATSSINDMLLLSGLKPDREVFASLIGSFVPKSKYDNIESSCNMLKKLLLLSNVALFSPSSFNNLIHVYSHRLDFKSAFDIINITQRKYGKVDIIGFKYLGDGLSKTSFGSQVLLKNVRYDALNYTVGDEDWYNLLLEVTSRMQDLSEGLLLYLEMRDHNVLSLAAFEILFRMFQKCNEDMFESKWKDLFFNDLKLLDLKVKKGTLYLD